MNESDFTVEIASFHVLSKVCMHGIQRVLCKPTQSVWYANNVCILCIDLNSNIPLIDISLVKQQVVLALITCASINTLCCATFFTWVLRFNFMYFTCYSQT